MTVRRASRRRATRPFALAPVVLLLAACSDARAPATPPAPRLTSPQATFDFGTVPEGARIRRVFRVRNDGLAPARIERVRPSCGCSTARVTAPGPDGERRPLGIDAPLAPGEAFDIEIVVDTEQRTGDQEFVTRVLSDDPAGVLRLSLKGVVEPLFTVEPPFLDLGTVARAQGGAAEVRVRKQDGRPFALAVRPPELESGVAVALRPIEPEPDGRSSAWAVECRMDPGVLAGAKRFALELVDGPAGADGAAAPGRHLLVVATVVGQWEPVPGRLMLGPLARGASVCRELAVARRAGVATSGGETAQARLIELMPAELAEHGSVEVSIEPVADPALAARAGASLRWQMRVTRRDDAGRNDVAQGLFWGRVRIAVDGAGGEEVDLPFSGLLVQGD